LGCALLHQPPVLFLDEPTAGVDPAARRNFWQTIHDLAHGGTTVLVTTHYMYEAERCDRLAMMSLGHLIALGTPAEVAAQVGGRTLEDAFIILQERRPFHLNEDAKPDDDARARVQERPTHVRFWPMLRKEFIQMKRDRLTLGIMIGIPVVQLLMFGYAIQTDGRHIPTVVLDRSRTPESRDLIAAFETPAASASWTTWTASRRSTRRSNGVGAGRHHRPPSTPAISAAAAPRRCGS
jgi:ABC-type glutathione transport system ATPase component